MAKKPKVRATRVEQLAMFFVGIEQLEALAVEIDLDWPADVKADAVRRLNRVIRAIRTSPSSE